jgi:hypothetical protein
MHWMAFLIGVAVGMFVVPMLLKAVSGSKASASS